MINPNIYDFDEFSLVSWLRDEAGSSNATYFKTNKQGGLLLQQVPEEFAKLLLFLKGIDLTYSPE